MQTMQLLRSNIIHRSLTIKVFTMETHTVINTSKKTINITTKEEIIHKMDNSSSTEIMTLDEMLILEMRAQLYLAYL
jgi:hypothetical protein